MLLIRDMRLRPGEEDDLIAAAAKALRAAPSAVREVRLLRSAVDARNRGDVRYVVTVAAAVDSERKVLAACRNSHVCVYTEPKVLSPVKIKSAPPVRPVVAGAGPAGLFAALTLCEAGAPPILLERGREVDRRAADVGLLRREGILLPESNIQFGEGGAGAFSDGKLHTGIKDGHLDGILRELVAAGAPEEILWRGEPHVGTDRLRVAVAGLREKMKNMGCDVRFGHRLEDVILRDGAVAALRVHGPQGAYELPCQSLTLAPGQSARDAYEMLRKLGVRMRKKPFAVGVRIEHRQRDLDSERYGQFVDCGLPHSSYKLVSHLPNGRAVYTFCVCPGGEVIASASEDGGIVTNGMSVFARDGENINGALLVPVLPEDLPDDPFAGLDYRRELEARAFSAGGGGFIAPAQTVGDFLRGEASSGFGSVKPSYLPGVRPAALDGVLPPLIADSLRAALPELGQRLRIFAQEEAVLTAVESRSSSPVQIERSDDLCCTVTGLRVCGEGAGWAGGIMSSAVDGIRCAEAAIAAFT